MDFDISKVKTTVDIDKGEVTLDSYGYFSNDLDSIRRAVTQDKINLKAVYTKLNNLLEPKYERRFDTLSGSFALFYQTDDKYNEVRY